MHVGGHRTVELEEFRIALERAGEGRVAFGFTLTTEDFRFLSCFRDNLDHLAVSARADALGCLTAAGSQSFRFR